MNRQAQALLLFVLGAAVLRAGLTDLYLRYLQAGFRPVLLAAGVALIVIAIATLWYDLRATRADQDEHAHREPRIAWLLMLPLFALIVIVPPALGSYAADRAGTVLQQPPGFPAQPATDPLPSSLLDYATRAVYDHGRSLGDRRVELTGFITSGNRGTPYLTRTILNCCAADALPIKVALSGQLPADLRPDVWLDVVGTYTQRQIKDEVNGRPIPFITVSRSTPVPAPADEYER